MTESELFDYAIHHYSNPSCKTAEEFANDFNTIIKIKKLLNRRTAGDDISFRLLLNHFMLMYNVFTPDACTLLLFAKLPKEHHPVVKTIATFLNYMPDELPLLDVDPINISLDQELVAFLREI